MKKILINVFPRLHISLIAMHNGKYRKNGGFGFSIDKPCLGFSFIESGSFTIIDERVSSFNEHEIARIIDVLEQTYELLSFKKKFTATIASSDIPTHTGFGTSTATRLAMLEALFLFNGHPYSKEDFLKYSRRGNTSGIGINTYFDGGYIFDIGVKQDDSALMPSSVEEVRNMPLVIDKGPMPEWNIGICIPKKIVPLTEAEEKAFFETTCPISENEVYKTLYHVVYGLLGSIKDIDIVGFTTAIREIQTCEWKASERHLYGSSLLNIEKKLYLCGVEAVGMSSLGPALFFIGNNLDSVVKHIQEKIPECVVMLSKTQNLGRTVKYD